MHLTNILDESAMVWGRIWKSYLRTVVVDATRTAHIELGFAVGFGGAKLAYL